MVSRRTRFAVTWRRAGLGLRLFVIALGITLFALLVFFSRPEEEAAAPGSGLLVFTLVNLNVVILCVLAFLIGRNIVKLVFDRRKNILGSRLRTRLVVAFVGLALIPTSILFFLASGLLSRAMEGWFSTQVEASVGGAVEIARLHHNSLKEFTRQVAQEIVHTISKEEVWNSGLEPVTTLVEKERKEWGLYSVKVLSRDFSTLIDTHNAAAVIDTFLEPELERESLERARRGQSEVKFEERDAGQFLRAYVPIKFGDPKASTESRATTPRVLVATLRASPELTQTLSAVNQSFREYKQLKLFAEPLRSGYILTLTMITGLILFSAIWIAFYIARELTVPLQRIAEATRSVAKGRYDVQIREVGDDEMGVLVRSFNHMTSDLKNSRREGERHRVFLETILANLAVGVIAVDSKWQVTSVNSAAARICGLDEGISPVGQDVASLLPPGTYEQVEPLLELVAEGAHETSGSPAVLEKELSFHVQGRELRILCTVGNIPGEGVVAEGYALLLDDITELAKAQHMAAWREVAQRIAHEIKNPLTPIQLSAQRLEKLVNEEQARESRAAVPQIATTTPGIWAKVVDCAQTIVEHVDSIKRLANEFSHFARMPQAEFAATDLNQLISNTLEPFAESQDAIVFQFIADSDMPSVFVDKEQIRRVLINLINNAISAVRTNEQKTTNDSAARITVRSFYDRRKRSISFEVADNGPGIRNADKVKIFEPYFTTKKGGTGLGLAIVTSIVSDHQGEIRVYDNRPKGAKFVVELPLEPKRATQRKFAV